MADAVDRQAVLQCPRRQIRVRRPMCPVLCLLCLPCVPAPAAVPPAVRRVAPAPDVAVRRAAVAVREPALGRSMASAPARNQQRDFRSVGSQRNRRNGSGGATRGGYWDTEEGTPEIPRGLKKVQGFWFEPLWVHRSYDRGRSGRASMHRRRMPTRSRKKREISCGRLSGPRAVPPSPPYRSYASTWAHSSRRRPSSSSKSRRSAAAGPPSAPC